MSGRDVNPPAIAEDDKNDHIEIIAIMIIVKIVIIIIVIRK